MSSNQRLFVVIAAYREAELIGRVVAAVRQVCRNVIVVDDASTDETGRRAADAGADVVTHAINRGQGAALKTGIDYALSRGADIIVTFDADGQHDPNDIPALVAPIQSGRYDVALGSRFLRPDSSNVPPLRRAVLKVGVVFTRLVSHIRVTDTHNGLRALSRAAAERIRIVHDRMAHASEILDEIVQHGLRYTEVPVTITYSDYSREKGQGNMAMVKIAVKVLLSKLSR